MLGGSSQLTIVVLALSLISCTVAPAIVFAEDTVSITNVARSSVSTGGANGSDGRDGQPGKDGTDGAPGQAGVSITNIAPGESKAIIKVESVVDGQAVVDYETTGSAEVETIVAATTSVTEVSDAAPDDVKHRLSKVLQELQLIITTYVSYLF